MKKDIESLINRLAKKGHDKECMVERGYCCEGFYKKKWSDQYPIYVGDVLNKVYPEISDFHQSKLIGLWHRCGLTKSVQDLFIEAEWQSGAMIKGHFTEDGFVVKELLKYPVDPAIYELFQYLIRMGL